MEIIKELLPGCFLLRPSILVDHRGCFVKTYHKGVFSKLGCDLEVHEEFFSISNLNVIRGMHFQIPPNEHSKLVYCIRGSALDVILDLRLGSNYGRVSTSQLSSVNGHIIFIPGGVAHGFLANEENTLMVYKTSSVHNFEFDRGVLWNSFGFNWGVNNPIISERDKNHIEFRNFISPFRNKE